MKTLKALLKKLTNKPQDWASGALARYPFIEAHERYHLQRVAHDFLDKTGGEVFAGPLAGMKIPRETPLADLPMYVIGCYEQEIHPILCEVICSPPPRFIDIGSAYGYYTVGLALQTNGMEAIGFEAEERPHWEKARALAECNGLAGRITQRGFCDPDSLKEVAGPGDFIMCDCEGGEVQLLDPLKIPVLAQCRILCEVHDFHAPGATACLIERFRKTHEITLLTEQGRNPSQYRILAGLTPAYQELSVLETRHIGKRIVTARFLDFKPLPI